MTMNWTTLLNADRRRQTTSPGDHRIEFERDFDRSVFSTPVKRLQDKAQVFPLEPHDAIRTRLTHSLEVSSVARGLATRISTWLLEKKEIHPGTERWIEAIAETCGLIHDLGNPPFGHAGEDAIRSWFERHPETLDASLTPDQLLRDFLQFEGNAQSLRLVATLQVLADYKGLNLTFGTLSALMKYVSPSDQASKKAKNRAWKKPGYFASENAVVAEIRSETGTGAARHPICFLVEAADDIVYLAADVEDGVKKGVMSWPELETWLKDAGGPSVVSALQGMEHILKVGSEAIAPGLEDDIYASAFRTAAIGVMVKSAAHAFEHHYSGIMEGRYEGALLKDSDAADLEQVLRKIGQEHVYQTHSTLKLELMGRRVIWELMDVLWEGAAAMPLTGSPDTSTFAGKSAALFSPNYRRVFQHFAAENTDLPERYHRLQLLTDYVCGMTDSFAKRLHAELFNGR
jgi:dGTPase